jgi:acetyl-CoA/propionyl-CoA carboxylase biotin carboxyl carrier protein
VTEAVTGLDLVEQQLQIATGAPLRLEQQDIALRGHAIEVRVTAEDPASSFLPATGEVVTYRPPIGPGVRLDTGIDVGSEVTSLYDSLLAKLITCGRDREEALERLLAALHDLRILGVTTNTGFLYRLVTSPRFRAGDLDTGLIERGEVELSAPPDEARAAAIAAAAVETLALQERATSDDPWDVLVGFRLEGPAPLEWELETVGTRARTRVIVSGRSDAGRVHVDEGEFDFEVADCGEQVRVTLDRQARLWDHAVLGDQRWVAAGPNAFAFRLLEPVVEGADATAEGALEAPMPGTVLAIRVAAGDQVAEGDILVVMESMKMELSLAAPADGIVADVHVGPGEGVRQGQPLVELEDAAA